MHGGILTDAPAGPASSRPSDIRSSRGLFTMVTVVKLREIEAL